MVLLLAVWALSLTVRLAFVANVLSQNSVETIVAFNWDSREYLHLAKNLSERGTYEIDTPESRFFAMLRTPGYPTFCAVLLKAGLGVRGVLYAQAVLGSLIPVIAAALAGAMFRRRSWAVAAGVVSIFSTTGIGLGAILLADLLFALTVVGAFALLYFAAAFDKRWGWWGAGVALAVGLMIKPAIFYLGPVIIAGAYMMSRGDGRRVYWRGLAFAVAMPAVAMGAWTAHNHAKTGGWVFSTVESQNLRHFMMPLTQESAKAGRLPDAENLTANHRSAIIRDLDDVMGRRLSAVELARRQQAEARAVLLANPGWAGAGLLSCAVTCMLDGWAWTPSQLPVPGAMGEAMFALNRWQINARVLVLGLALLVGLERVLRRNGAPRAAGRELRREWGAMGACAALAAYFFVISGTSFSTGFRILYPLEFAITLMAIGGVRAGWRMLFAGATAATAALAGEPEGAAILAVEPAAVLPEA